MCTYYIHHGLPCISFALPDWPNREFPLTETYSTDEDYKESSFITVPVVSVEYKDLSDFKMVFRNVIFKDFEGVTFADAKIQDLIPKRFDSRPSALENA